MAQISVILVWEIKDGGYWYFFDSGNWKSQNIYNFQVCDWKFNQLYWKTVGVKIWNDEI